MKKQNVSLLKRSIFIIVIFVLAAGFIFGESFKPRFYLKFGGAGSTMKAGDFGDFVTISDTYWQKVSTQPSAYTYTSKIPSQFLGGSGEIGIETKRFSVGVSAGVIRKQVKMDYIYTSDLMGGSYTFNGQYTFTAVPIFLLFHYKLIDSKMFTASLTIGEGVYLTTYKEENTRTNNTTSIPVTTETLKGKRNQPGFHAGATFDIKLTSNIGFYIEGAYRFSKLENINAEYTTGDTGSTTPTKDTLYYTLDPNTKTAFFSAGKPKDALNSRTAVFKMNGVSLSAGIKITLGKGYKKEKPVALPNEGIE